MKRIYDVKYQLGAHTCFSGKICDTLWTGINYGMYATQFFMGPPQSFARSKISDTDIVECKKILKRFPMKVFSHFPYLANLAGSVKTLAWTGDKGQDKKTEIVINSLEYELSILANFSGGVVIHPGSYKDKEKGLKTIAQTINKINFSENSKLVLENAAGQGTSLATTLEELKTILDNIDEEKKKYIGICIDTCHIFAYGEYDFSNIKDIDIFFEKFDSLLGLKYFSLLHLNDSEKPLKSRVDRHACLGTGYIWNKSFDSLIHLLNKCEKYDIPIVLETHGIDMLTVAFLKNKK